MSTSGFAASQNYENFSLPRAGLRVPGAPTSLSYKSPRFNLQSKGVQLKQPGINHQQFIFAKEAFISEKRDEAIKLLRQELESGYKRNRDNMLLRLGQLYAEKYMELSYRENELYSQHLLEHEKSKASNRRTKSPTLDNSRSQRYLQQALYLFYKLEREFPKHPKIDEVIFFIGFVEMESGKGPKGAKYLERVIHDFPSSRKFDDAVVYLGDYYFDKHQFKEAMVKFRILLGRRDSPLVHYALYKYAWCELNTSSETKALKDMKILVSALKGSPDIAKFNLREQALKDLVVFYGEVGNVDEAVMYFSDTVGREKALDNLRLIADILRSKARDDQAIRAYTKLLTEFGDSVEAPKLHLGLYECLARTGKTEQAVNHLVKSIDRYGATSEWAKKFPNEKSNDVKSTLETLQSEAQRVAFFYHSAAQKSANRGYYQHALNLYGALLRSFPDHPDRKKISFYRAEILFNQEKWVEAANAYMETAKIPPKDKLADESIYNALLSLDRMTAKSETIERYSRDEQKKVSQAAQEIPDSEKRFIEVAETYLRDYPDGGRIVDVRFRIAAIYYRYHHFDRALEMFHEIVMKHPHHRSAPTAASLVLDIYNIKKDYENLDKTAGEFALLEGLGDGKFKSELAEIKGEIGFKKIEPLEVESKWKEAGDAYLDFYHNNPKSAVAEKALYNAFISYDKANESGKAAEASRLFISKYPNHEYTERLTLSLARLAEKHYDFETAQKLYQDFYHKYPKNRETHKALYNAAVFAELLEQNRSALSLYDEYLRDKGISSDEKKAILISQAKIYRREGNWDRVNLTYRRLARDARTVEEKLALLGELARFYERAGRVSERNNLVNEIRWLFESVKGIKNSGAAVQYVAEAKFKAIAKQKQRYLDIHLKFPPEDLLYLMHRKQKWITKLEASYDAVVEIGVPDWGVAALLEKSELYEHFVKSYRSVPVPKKYSGKDREEVEKQLKEIDTKLVQPLENKSQDILKLCVSKATEFHVINEYAGKCRERLRKSESFFEASGFVPVPQVERPLLTGYATDHRMVNLRLEEFSAKKPSSSETEAFLEYTALLDSTGKHAEADTNLKHFFVENTDRRALFLLGVHYYDLKKRDLATYFFSMLEKDDKFIWKSYVLHNMAMIALQDRNRPLGLAYLEKAVKAEPAHAAPLEALGALYLQSRSYEDAAMVFSKAFDLNRDSEDAALGLGASLEGQGKFEAAHSAYTDFILTHNGALALLYNDSIILGNRLKRHHEATQQMERYIQQGGKETAKAHEIIQSWR